LTVFVDTNVFIRLLSQDDLAKARASFALLQQAERGEVALFTSEVIVAEVVYVLASKATYNLPPADIVRLLRPILENPGLRIEHKRSVLRALDLFESARLDFEDCLTVEQVRRQKLAGLYSYDRGFDRVPGLVRREP
jgi:predicted nucleic acid-binding protein